MIKYKKQKAQISVFIVKKIVKKMVNALQMIVLCWLSVTEGEQINSRT
jgi:hypothetical protein